LMIAGRFKWRPAGTSPPAKIGLASFDFPTGTLLLTEASSKKRASLHVVAGEAGLAAHDPGGLNVLEADLPAFRERLQSESHTLKRALTDPHLFDGIGNWLSDEILHAGKLSLFQLTTKLSDAEIARLYEATQKTTRFWIEKLRAETAGGTKFPEKVSAFKEGMAVHGRYKQPCPTCGSPVQRIRYADNEANYCATCQTGGRVLADRSLSRLLKADRPRRRRVSRGAASPAQLRFPLFQRPRPIGFQEPRQRAVGQHSPFRLARRAVIGFVVGIADALDR